MEIEIYQIKHYVTKPNVEIITKRAINQIITQNLLKTSFNFSKLCVDGLDKQKNSGTKKIAVYVLSNLVQKE